MIGKGLNNNSGLGIVTAAEVTTQQQPQVPGSPPSAAAASAQVHGFSQMQLPSVTGASSNGVTKEGWLRKRGARMHRWTTRYIILSGPKLSYKVKQESATVRGAYDLVPGCILTEIQEEVQLKGKKLYSFWLVWPKDKNDTGRDADDAPTSGGASGKEEDDSDDDLPSPGHSAHDNHPSGTAAEGGKPKDLKQIVQSEVMGAEKQRKKAEEQLNLHYSQDASISLGYKIAAAAVGGVLVGALTAGIGLVPYAAIVGMAAAASGGAVVLQYRKPSDSRLILASENMLEISLWRAAIEDELTKLEMQGKPLLPEGADPNVISHILGISTEGGAGGWVRVGLMDGMRIMQQTDAWDGSKCRKAQVVLKMCPINVFVMLMDLGSLHWPKYGDIKVACSVDDHVDILEVRSVQKRPRTEIKSSYQRFKRFLRKNTGDLFADPVDVLSAINIGVSDRSAQPPPVESETVAVQGYLNRFWRLNDDGSYIIICTTATDESIIEKGLTPLVSNKSTVHLPKITAVVTVSPRRDHDQYDYDIASSLVTCTIQAQELSYPWTDESFLNAFLDEYLAQLLDAKHAVLSVKFDLDEKPVAKGSQPPWLGPPAKLINAQVRKAPSTDEYADGKRIAPLKLDKTKFEGVTTVQPGLESIPNNQRNSKTRSGSHEDPPVDSKMLQQAAMLGARQSSMSKIPSTPGSAAQPANANVVAVAKKKAPTRKEKAEASLLRSMIAAKEFELHRLEKLIKKKGSLVAAQELSQNSPMISQISVPPTPGSSVATAGPSSSSTQAAQALMTVLNSQQLELNELKDSYFQLTGVLYENSTRRRFLGRRKPSNDKKNEAFTAAYAAVNATSTNTGETNSLENVTGVAPLISYPRLWKRALDLAAEDYAPKLGRAAKQSIIIVSLFILSFCVALYLEMFVGPRVALTVLDVALQPIGFSASNLVSEVEARSRGMGASFFRGLDVAMLLSVRLITHLPAATSAFVERLLQG